MANYLSDLGHTPLTTVLLERDCLAFGLSTLRTSRETFIAVDSNGRQMAFNKAGSVLNSRPAAPLTQNKHSTRLILQKHGLPAPRGRRFGPNHFASAKEYAEELGYPLVLKPLSGAQGQGIITGIANAEELHWAFEDIARSKFSTDDFLVEEHVDGEAYRIIVVGDQALSALISRRGSVTGDGVRTVRQLVERRQQLRSQNPHLLSRSITVDERMEHLLVRQGASVDSVLKDGRTVDFTYGSNTSQGGEHAQVLEFIHPSILEASVRAVQAIPGLGFAGVDFLVPDIGSPLDEQRAAICEINSMPAVDSHEYPLYGEAVSVSREIVVKSAALSGVQMNEYQPQVSLRVAFDCSTTSKDYLNWQRTRAQHMGLRCRIRATQRGVIKARVRGQAEVLAAWLALAFHNPQRVRIRSMEVHHA